MSLERPKIVNSWWKSHCVFMKDHRNRVSQLKHRAKAQYASYQAPGSAISAIVASKHTIMLIIQFRTDRGERKQYASSSILLKRQNKYQ